MEKPSFSALVESAIKNIFLSLPSVPTSSPRARWMPSSWSSFKSPVMTTLPCGVSIETPIRVGDRVRNGKKFHTCRADGHGLPDFNGNYFGLRHIRILFLAPLNHDGCKILRVDGRCAEARSVKGMPPMWSRWPCVMMTPFTRLAFFSKYFVLGRM